MSAPRVHIVGIGLDDERILARLARILADGTGWSLSEKPDPTADLNVFLPYLVYPKAKWTATLSAAWFTHLETNQPSKAAIWDRVSEMADLRVTSAPQYESLLRSSGLTALVTPPLDREVFRPSGKGTSIPRPVVGTSGFVYADGRKGEGWMRRLRDDLAARADVVACGRGWRITTKRYRHSAEVADFYRGLDVYVCTSTVEGVPYGPLEALASGIPVVIPNGVGLLDTLPDAPGIERYERGDYASFAAATDRALAARAAVDPLALRAVTERFSAAQWCADWQAAVGAVLAGPNGRATTDAGLASGVSLPPVAELSTPLPDWRGRSGVVVVAYWDHPDKPEVQGAKPSAKRLIASLREHMPKLPVALIAAESLGVEDILIQVPESDVDPGARSPKTRMYELAPKDWEYVAYLDADTVVRQPIDGLFQPLQDGWDMCMTPNPAKYVSGHHMVRPDNGDECAETFRLWGLREMFVFNGGVLSFRRSPATEALFALWHFEWQRWKRRDQAALLRALWANPPRIWPLSNQFNLIGRYDKLERRTVIEHRIMDARWWLGVAPNPYASADERRLRERSAMRHPAPEDRPLAQAVAQ